MLNKFVFGTLLLTSLVGLSGCNTFEGAGRDVKGAGEALTDTAHDSKEAIHNRK
ncbi:MAG: entericidin A/B family lipoprotein [Janthinobacterium lividum]